MKKASKKPDDPIKRATAECCRCVYNDLKKCGKSFCMMPQCVNERVKFYAEKEVKSI